MSHGFTAAILTIRGARIACILVRDADTFAGPAAAIIRDAERYFPTLPILLVSPRVGDFSATFATWDAAGLGRSIDTNKIEWLSFTDIPEPELPF